MTTPHGSLAAALDAVRGRLAAAAERAGRRADGVRLVVVTKAAPPAIFDALAELGVEDVGENRVVEAAERLAGRRETFTTHFIGRLQSNKARRAVPLFDVFHGVDGAPLVDRLDRIAGELGVTRDVFVQVNVSGEDSKAGVAPDDVAPLVEHAARADALRLRGLMTMAPYSDDAEDARPVFAALRALRDDVAARLGVPLPDLSMGMSGDAEVAVEEGATLVRVGSAIVGRLDPNPSDVR